jgi:diguanylate cyclase (GGDEF)-like protein/PAS domain S-box-containing protein
VITYWNKSAERITGYTAAQAVGRACRDNMLNHVTANGTQLCLTQCPLSACMEDGNVREAEVFLHHVGGHRLPVVVRASPIRNAAGEIIGAVESFSSNTEVIETRRQIRKIRRTALTDPLTEVGNRKRLESHLRMAVAEFGQQGAVGLIFADIDHFKEFNDTYGHAIGDKVLRMVARTLRHNLRSVDMIGRWGGEEFLAIMHEIDSLELLKNLADKLCALVERSHLDLHGRKLEVTISVGATILLPTDTLESLVHRADQLMYQSKQAGRNRVTVG